MRSWYFVAAAIFFVGLLFLTQSEGYESYADYGTALAQRQLQQFAGETRYNDLARVQGTRIVLPSDKVRDALEQVIPTATSNSDSLLSLFKDVRLSAAAGQSGTGVEQTGGVQQKIDFCESVKTVDCSMLSDPRMAECGFCHRNGTDSRGRPHRGGMFISSDDQIRANQVSTANGNLKAAYKPTMGTCKPVDFTLMKENCDALERHMECQRAGAATSANQCGQCYGSAPAGSNGLFYVGQKPKTYTAVLHVSHPGMHSNNGRGLTVKTPRGETTLAYSNVPLLDPQTVYLELAEGDSITLSISGVPPVWCAWLSSPDGKRSISLDIGVDYGNPPSGFTVAGDKRSLLVKKTFEKSDKWLNYQQSIPNSVLFYRRRDEVIPGAIVSAWYGIAPNAQGINVTNFVKAKAGANEAYFVSNQHGDPIPGIPKYLWITHDNGKVTIAREGQDVDPTLVYNNIVLGVTIPATLSEPYYQEDKEWCPSGPMVLTAEGAGRMGATSCFKVDGSFNPSVYCIQQLWTGSGADPKGKLYPKNATEAKALAKPTLDATMDYFNNSVNIAMYGVDMNGAPQEFAIIRQNTLDFFGIDMRNPCDGPNSQSGPHSVECLDYLYRTSGNPSQDGIAVDRTKLPYAYCSAEGQAAPLTATGAVNTNRTSFYNSLGAIPNIRASMQDTFMRANDSADFDDQARNMRSCYNVQIKPPVEDAATCPPPNAEDWQCFPVNKIPTNVVSPNAIPAFRYDRTYGKVVGLSTTGGNIHLFPNTDACLAWTRGPKNNPKPNGVNMDQPFLRYAETYIKGRA